MRAQTADHPLTLAEVEVLWLIGDGLTNQEIAARLHRSTDGIASACWTLFRKIRARNRAHAVRRGFELGLLRVGGESDDG